MKLRPLQIVRFFNDPAAYESRLEYSQYDKTFFMRVPEHMIGFACEDLLQKKYIKSIDLRGGAGAMPMSFFGKTEDEVIAKAVEYLKLFVANLPSTRKVILYGIKYFGPGVEPRGGASGGFRGSDKYASLDIDYIVCYETTHGYRKTYEERSEKDGEVTREDVTDVTSAGYMTDGYHVAEWTEEREAYFQGLSKAMMAMVKKVDKFVSNDQEFIAQIDAGAHLLLQEAR